MGRKSSHRERSTGIDARVWLVRGAVGLVTIMAANTLTNGQVFAPFKHLTLTTNTAPTLRTDILQIAATDGRHHTCDRFNSSAGRQLVATLGRDHHAIVTVTSKQHATRNIPAGVTIQISNAPTHTSQTFQFDTNGILTDAWKMRGNQMIISEYPEQQAADLAALEQQIIDACRSAIAQSAQTSH